MLASLIAWSALATAQNPQFPKPNVETPAVLRDASIFKYIDEGDKSLDWRPFPAPHDWSNLAAPATKPDAIKLKVLLAVAERDFSDPHYSNILESRDKARLLAAAERLKAIYSVVSGGTIALEVVPRFYAEPIFDINDFRTLIDTEFNKTKFESDDSVERGPFAAVIGVSSSHVELKRDADDSYLILGFGDLNGSSPDMWLEENLFYMSQASIKKRLGTHFPTIASISSRINGPTGLADALNSFEPDYEKLFDPNYRQDGDLLTKWAESGSLVGPVVTEKTGVAVATPGTVELKDDVLVYSELSLMRAGSFALPSSKHFSGAKSLKFDIKTKSKNPLAVTLWFEPGPSGYQKEEILGTYPGMIPINADGNWQSVSINLAGLPNPVTGITIGVPMSFRGTTRIRAELNQYSFRNFELSQDAGTVATGSFFAPASWETEESLKQVLTTGTKFARRTALESIDKIKAYKGLAPTLLELAGDLDAGIAHDATKAYFEMVLSGQPTPEELTSLGKFLRTPPNDASREVALSYVGRNAAFANVPDLSGNSVHQSYRVRLQALKALGAMYWANVPAKEFCRNLLLTATSQDMALLRKASAEQLDPTIKENMDRLVFLMVNDPCESVRLTCLKIVATAPNAPKDKIMGTLADDSPTLREQIPSALGSKSPYLREALQKMVVDQDPYVRVSALRTFASVGNVQAGEIQNVFTDKHPAVQIALLEGAKKGAWVIPADALDKLKNSSIKAIATLAAEVK